MTDIEIARNAEIRPIREIAKALGMDEDDLELYGKYKAKISEEYLQKIQDRPDGKLVLVTAINPTPAGEGKTTTSVGLGQAFGRLGCLMAGCCYGRETDSWFSITFQESPFAPNGVALIPTQIMSSVADFLNFAILLVVAKKAKSDGQVAGMYLILYSIGRFFLECFRGDPRGSVGALSTSQFIAIFILAVGIAVYLYCTKKYPKNASEKTEEN